MFKRDWFEVVDAAPALGTVVRGWDLAASETVTAAFTSGVKMRRTPEGIFYIEDVVRFRGSPGKVDQTFKNTASQDGYMVRVDLPQDPGQAGKSQVKYFTRLLAGYNVRCSTETGSKETRAEPLSAQAEAGNVKLVRGLWNDDYLDELCLFPFSDFKDQVDASSRAFAALIPKRSEDDIPQGPEVVRSHG
jgi:predicted phage terminase large subunit-like protein